MKASAWLQAAHGPFNWILLAPDAERPALSNAGSQGLPEMVQVRTPPRWPRTRANLRRLSLCSHTNT
jgi:hypothetical protein